MPVPLQVDGISKAYDGKTVVDDLSFSVNEGEIYCIVGPNGAGKTTALSIIQGLRKPDSGEVRIYGHAPRKAPSAVRARLGVLPQAFMGFGTLTVVENLQYFADLYGVNPDIDESLQQLSLTEHADQRLLTLSGGTIRRVGIMTALIHDPDLVFLDEPTAGVDPASRRELWTIVRRLRNEGRSVVLTTHYMDEAEALSDTVAIIHRGRFLAEGTPEEVNRVHGAGRILRIKGFDNGPPEFLLSQPGARLENDQTLSMPLGSDGAGQNILTRLAQDGVAYKEISIKEPNLDDTFIRMVSNGGGP